ncbi:hypothetical protein EV182_006204 [Spiromyces aspiralis]|uniref:Uncharacterized protein n=1 Tax=Spiromyces aspiralis TaxID=68401 RepID=A0ACC1H909_9FUNG|nr:hypothetical protein EV182_006204 [Spiromyces aspiralis]
MSPRAYDFHDSHHRHHQQQQQLPAYNPTQFRWLCNSVNEQSPFEHHGAAMQYTSLFTDDEFERSGTQAVSSLEQSTVSLYSQLPQQQRDPQHYRAKGPANIDETPFSGRAIL